MQTGVPIKAAINPQTGEMHGECERYVKHISELSGCYRDKQAFDQLVNEKGQEIAYVVQHFIPNQSEGDLIFGTSTLQPGKVSNEFFLTRGHLHNKADRPEIYHCVSGHGVMLMESLDGKTTAIELKPNSIVYVPGYWIHRSVNVGDSELVTVFCYPADAGQDYEIIASAGGMSTLIVDDEQGGWKEIPNPDYRPRKSTSLNAHQTAGDIDGEISRS